jgi:hypothetical protein
MPSPCISDSDTIHLDDTTTPGVLVADAIISPNAGNLLVSETDHSGLYVPGKPVVVSSIPGSPSEGDEIIYQVAGYTDHYWHMVYSSGHWRFIGGSEIVARDDTQDTLTGLGGAGGWGTLGGTPSIALPFTGAHWRVEFGTEASWDGGSSSADHAQWGVGLSVDSAAPTTKIANSTVHAGPNLGHTDWDTASFGPLEITATATLALQWRCFGDSGIATFQKRWITARPVYL